MIQGILINRVYICGCVHHQIITPHTSSCLLFDCSDVIKKGKCGYNRFHPGV